MRCEGPPYSLITFWSGAFIAIVAAAVGHLFTLWRDSINRKEAEKISRSGRKREIVSFLAKWESETDVGYRMGGHAGSVVDIFKTKRHELIRMAAGMENDYSGEEVVRFRTLVGAIRDMTPGAVDNPDGQKALLQAIRNLLTFVRSN